MRAHRLHVPGPEQRVAAGGQLRRQAPQALPAHQDHAHGARLRSRYEDGKWFNKASML
jgi:hypothetical protein